MPPPMSRAVSRIAKRPIFRSALWHATRPEGHGQPDFDNPPAALRLPEAKPSEHRGMRSMGCRTGPGRPPTRSSRTSSSGPGSGRSSPALPFAGERVTKYNRLTEIAENNPGLPYGLR
jgi:hypothetical protein